MCLLREQASCWEGGLELWGRKGHTGGGIDGGILSIWNETNWYKLWKLSKSGCLNKVSNGKNNAPRNGQVVDFTFFFNYFLQSNFTIYNKYINTSKLSKDGPGRL